MNDYISEEELFDLIKKLNLNETVVESPRQSSSDNPKQPGFILIENNKIYVEVSDPNASFPTIQAVYPVQLLINGVLCSDKVTVTPEDRIEWSIVPEPLFKIEVSEDRLEAYLQLISKTQYGWKLKDKGRQELMLVEAEKDESVIIQNLSMADIMNTLKGMRIVKNIHAVKIFQELSEPTYEPILIAQGVRHEPSQDAKLEIYFSEEVKSVILENELTKTVDFRNHLHIPSVKRGEVIAKKIPFKMGTVGYDVFGDLIKPELPKDIKIIAKEHIEITPEGEVIALKDGRPRITGTAVKYFDITTSYVISGDVDLKTGNIVFSGDVIVYGNVMEGMIIESLGNVYIIGNVYQSTITATGSITVKGNIVNSNLYSGFYGVIFNRLYIHCKSLSELLENLIQASKLLMSLIESKGQMVKLGQVLLTLIESKFKDIPKITSDILMCIHNIQSLNEGEMEELKNSLFILLEPIKMTSISSYDPIIAIQTIIQDTFLLIERMQETSANVDIEQCHVSTIKSTGDIVIRKEGVLQSNLFCKGNILFLVRDSVCRGCQLEAQGTISAALVGGDLGGESVLKAGKRITLQQMSFGRIIVGRFSRDILKPIRNMVAYIERNTLIVEGSTKDTINED